jgi:hypothetical protein
MVPLAQQVRLAQRVPRVPQACEAALVQPEQLAATGLTVQRVQQAVTA